MQAVCTLVCMGNGQVLCAGQMVRCPGLGMGTVVEIVSSEFGDVGKIIFPHRDIAAKYPVDRKNDKLGNPLSSEEITALVNSIITSEVQIARTWEHRETIGESALKSSDPFVWAGLLGAYGNFRAEGNEVSSIDKEIVEMLCELLAAELCTSTKMDYEGGLRRIEKAYSKSSRVSLAT